jgi:hypothetical protein
MPGRKPTRRLIARLSARLYAGNLRQGKKTLGTLTYLPFARAAAAVS